jgi:hypothetical protein
MSNSSAQQTYSITSSDTITFDSITLDTSTWNNMSSATGHTDTITISNGGTSYAIGGAGNYTTSYYTGGAGATVGGITNIGSISSIDTSAFKISLPEEWVDCFPDFKRIEKMCEEYPGLKIAYEKFVTTYKLVADHYDTPEDKRPKP